MKSIIPREHFLLEMKIMPTNGPQLSSDSCENLLLVFLLLSMVGWLKEQEMFALPFYQTARSMSLKWSIKWEKYPNSDSACL